LREYHFGTLFLANKTTTIIILIITNTTKNTKYMLMYSKVNQRASLIITSKILCRSDK